MARQWRVAASVLVLFNEVNRRWPHRDKASDGTIGNAAHAARWEDSDHNPWIVDRGVGVVRAGDVDSGPGLNPDERHDRIGDVVAEKARLAGLQGHPAMGPGAYVIHERHIASATSNPPWSWRPYTGKDPHTSHPHVSVTTRPGSSGYDSTRGWGIWPAQPKPVPLDVPKGKRPTLWMRGPKHPHWTKIAQRELEITEDGVFGKRTRRAVRRYRRRHGIRPYSFGVVGPKVWRALLAKA